MTPGVVPVGGESNVRKGQVPSSSSTPAKDSPPVSGPAARVVISAAAREAHANHEPGNLTRAGEASFDDTGNLTDKVVVIGWDYFR